MTSVRDMVKQLLPKGSRGDDGCIELYPRWPIDLFAVTAYLIKACDAYTYIVGNSKNNIRKQLKSPKSRDALQAISEAWRDSPRQLEEIGLESELRKHWKRIVSCEKNIAQTNVDSDWVESALRMMIIADEACKGVGFIIAEDGHFDWITKMYYGLNSKTIKESNLTNQKDANWYVKAREDMRKTDEAKKAREKSKNLTATILVSPALATVQPKARMATVGCSLRSVSHHLALLPPLGQVSVHWHQHQRFMEKLEETSDIKILFVPVPFTIHGTNFTGKKDEKEKWGYFDIEQEWLEGAWLSTANGEELSITEFIIDLIKNALNNEIKKIDFLLMPELALNEETYKEIVTALSKDYHEKVEIFIAGVKTENKESGKTINAVRTTHIIGDDRGDGMSTVQRKHHRWSIDKNQIKQYNLGEAFQQDCVYWEDIDINDREINFNVFRNGSCFTTLICEDLARIDPCQSVIRAIGPNLVIALLMDGPQLPQRWPGRYAVSLSDDPGSSVLSVTSFGLIRRSNDNQGFTSREVALWSDEETGKTPIKLGEGRHAILIKLAARKKQEITLDGRVNGDNVFNWVLTGNLGITSSYNCPNLWDI